MFLIANVAVLALVVFPLQQSVASAEAARVQATLEPGGREETTEGRGGPEDEQGAGGHRAQEVLHRDPAEGFRERPQPDEFLARTRRRTVAPDVPRGAIRSARRSAEQQPLGFKGDVTLVGDYADIRKFLYEVETSQEFVVIERVALSQPSAAQGGAQLELALSVATYFLPTPPPAVVSQ